MSERVVLLGGVMSWLVLAAVTVSPHVRPRVVEPADRVAEVDYGDREAAPVPEAPLALPMEAVEPAFEPSPVAEAESTTPPVEPGALAIPERFAPPEAEEEEGPPGVPPPTPLLNPAFGQLRADLDRELAASPLAFEKGSPELTAASRVTLGRVATLFAANPDVVVEVAGHTDNYGKTSANRTLSRRRAQAVVDYLASLGITRDRLVARGYGDTQPVAPNGTREGRALNRRIEFRF